MSGRIVVTGGAGFIGSAFVARLNAAGLSDIVIVDELGTGSRWQNLRKLKYSDYLHKDEFLDLVLSGKLDGGVSGIVHMGACSSTTERDADFLMRNNFRYTKILCEWSLKEKIRFIYASSAATYGAGENGYSDDESNLHTLLPLNMYGYSKQLFDTWAKTRGYLNRIVGLKFFNVFGPNEYHKEDMRSMVLKSWAQIRTEKKVRLFKSYLPNYTDGDQKRDFVYIKDCIEVMYWLLQNVNVNGIYNLGTGNARSWNDLSKAVFSALGEAPSIEYIDMPESLRTQYQYFTQAKMDKLQQAGYSKSFYSLEDAVKDYVVNYLETTDRYI